LLPLRTEGVERLTDRLLEALLLPRLTLPFAGTPLRTVPLLRLTLLPLRLALLLRLTLLLLRLTPLLRFTEELLERVAPLLMVPPWAREVTWGEDDLTAEDERLTPLLERDMLPEERETPADERDALECDMLLLERELLPPERPPEPLRDWALRSTEESARAAAAAVVSASLKMVLIMLNF